MKRSKCTLEAVSVVWISLREKWVRPFPACPEDEGMVRKLILWLGENDILPVPGTGGRSGGGSYSMCFYPEDAAKIIQWLASEGVKLK